MIRRQYLWLGLALVLSLSLGMGLRLLAIHNTDQIDLQGYPFVDDSYYYFTLGHHLALGQGVRIDSIHLTTGFQPLWGFISAIPYFLFRDSLDAPIRGLQVIGSLVGLATAIVIYDLARRLSRSPIIALIVMNLWWLSPRTITHNLNGMETSLAVLGTFILLLFLLIRLQAQSLSLRDMAVLGILAGIAFLIRVDMLILELVVLFILLTTIPQQRLSHLLQRIALFGLCMVVILIPWSFFTFSIGKSPLPESGEAVRISAMLYHDEHSPIPLELNTYLYTNSRNIEFFITLALDFLTHSAQNLYLLLPYDLAVPFVESRANLAILIACVIILGLIMVVSVRTLVEKQMFRAWRIYALGMFVAYTFYILSSWFYQRYTVPVSESFSVLASTCILMALARRFRLTPQALLATRTAFVLIFAGTYLFQYTSSPDFNWVLYGLQKHDKQIDFYQATQWLNENVKPGEVVGAFQSGLIGYYNHFTLYNLDGKVNRDAQKALLDGTIWQYLCQSKVTYVVDQQHYIDRLLYKRTADWNPAKTTLVYHIPANNGLAESNVEVHKLNCSS